MGEDHWFSEGQKEQDPWDLDEKSQGSNGQSPGKGFQGPRRFWLKVEEEKRVMFLDGVPFRFWEHNWKDDEGRWSEFEPCHVRNSLGKECVLDGIKAVSMYHVGMFSIIDFSQFQGTKHIFQFDRRLYPAKMGGTKKPGTLQKLKRLKDKYGQLAGCVFDIYRTGAMSPKVGDEFTLVERVDPKDFPKYIEKMRQEFNGRPSEEHLKFHPWEPIDYRKVIKPRSLHELKGLLGIVSSGSQEEPEEPVSDFEY